MTITTTSTTALITTITSYAVEVSINGHYLGTMIYHQTRRVGDIRGRILDCSRPMVGEPNIGGDRTITDAIAGEIRKHGEQDVGEIELDGNVYSWDLIPRWVR